MATDDGTSGYDDDRYRDPSYFDDASRTYILIVTTVYCVLSIIILPPLVILGGRYERWRQRRRGLIATDDHDTDDDDEEDAEGRRHACAHKSSRREYRLPSNAPTEDTVERSSSPTRSKEGRIREAGEEILAALTTSVEVTVGRDHGEGVDVVVKNQPRKARVAAAKADKENGVARSGTAFSRSTGEGVPAKPAGLSAVVEGSAVTGVSNRSGGTTKSSTSTMLSGRSVGQRVTDVNLALLDKFLIPSYPDREDNRVHSATGGRSVVSTALTHLTRTSSQAQSILSSGPVATGMSGRHRHANGKAGGINLTRVRALLREEIVAHGRRRPVGGGDGTIPDEAERLTELQYHTASHVSGGTGSTLKGCRDKVWEDNGPRAGSDLNSAKSGSQFFRRPIVDDVRPDDAADANDPGKVPKLPSDETGSNPYRFHNTGAANGDDVNICCGPRALWMPSEWVGAFNYLVYLTEMDGENQRLIKLSVPLVTSSVTESVFDNVTYALIGNFLGTDAVAAYAVVQVIVGFADTFIHGLTGAFWTVGSHAVGAENYNLAGQYVQICSVMYVIWSVPILGLWCFVVDDVILAFGLGEDIARMGLDYTRVVVFHYMMEGVATSLDYLLDITGHEKFSSYMQFAEGLVDLSAIAVAVTLYPDADLKTVGYIHLGVGVLFYIVTYCCALYRGWLNDYWKGIFGSFALTNMKAVRILVRAAIPLSIGYVLSYGEWEILTVLVAKIGPAEVSAWAIIGSIWETFEASTEGVTSAAAIRVALHLGRGSHVNARISAYKAILLGCSFAWILTSCFFIIGEDLSTWFTSDPVLRALMNSTIPLIGIGNATMTFGMMSWTIIGAQGRYGLGTTLATVTSWGLTLPVSATLVVVFDMGIDAVVSAVVIGYATTGTVLSYVLLRSDWVRVAKIVHEMNAEEEEELKNEVAVA